MECPTCHFVVSPDEEVQGACQVCGTDLRPERDQPGGSVSDGRLFNMKEPGYGQDMGGNPLQEGILGDWQNRMVRDESFASVSSSLGDEESDKVYPSALVKGDMYHINSSVDDWFTRRTDVDLPYWVRTAAVGSAVVEPQHGLHNGVVGLLRFLQPKIDGIDAMSQARDIVNTYSPFRDFANMQPPWAQFGQNLTVQVEVPYDEYLPVAQEIIQTGAQPSNIPESLKALARSMHAGQVPFPPGVRPEQVKISSFEKEAILPLLGLGARALAAPLARGAVAAGGKVLPKVLKGLGGTAKKAPGAVGRGVMYHQLGQALMGGGQQAGPGAAGMMPSMPPRNLQQLAAVETPGSLDEIGVQADDPEQVDPHELNDTAGGGAYRVDVNDIGGTADPFQGEQHQGPEEPDYNDPNFSTGDEEWDGLLDVLPKLLEYYESDESGMNDPDIRALVERMQASDPDWETNAQDLESVFAKVSALPPSVAPTAVPTGNPAPNVQVPGQQSPEGGVHGVCNVCGAGLNADGTCPAGHQGGAGVRNALPGVAPAPEATQQMQPQMYGKTALHDHQGPTNAEQFAAVAELLTQQGREQEITAMLKEPWNYAEELATVQNKANQPPTDLTAPEQPPAGAQPPPPGMPPPGGPPGLGGPQMPLAAITAALTRVGADPIAPRCPKCNSATTSVSSKDGSEGVSCHCHRCGNIWEPDDIVTEKVTSREATPRVMAPEHQDLHVHGPVPEEAVPFADQEQPEDVREERDTGRTWATVDGEPLKVGSTYELTSPQYSIPDLVQVQAVKPDAVNLKFIGEYSAHGGPEEDALTYEHEVTLDEAQLGNYEFNPAAGETDQQETDSELLEENQATYPDQAPGQQGDLSTPHERTTMVEKLVRSGMGLREATTMVSRRPYEIDDWLQQRRQQEMRDTFKQTQPQFEDSAQNIMQENEQYYQDQRGNPAAPPGGEVENARTPAGLTWNPGNHGRGVLGADGTVHAWPEENATHEQWVAANPHIEPEAFFMVDPGGEVAPYSFEGATQFTPTQEMSILGAHPEFKPQSQAEGGGDLFNFSNTQDTHDKVMDEIGEAVDPDLAWLRGSSTEEAPADLNGEEPIDPDLAWLREGGSEQKTAGRHYTPSQQKEFIDEQGEARNRDKLNLDGTHYTMSETEQPEEHPGLFM